MAAPAWTLALLLLPAATFPALGPRYGGALSVGMLDLAASHEPQLPRTVEDSLVMGLVHETLVGVGPEGSVRPGLAEAWDAAADGREWTLRIRPGAVFHGGEPVRATDVARSLRRFLRSSSPAALRLARDLEGGADFRTGARDGLPGLSAPDPAHVVLRYVSPRALPLAPLSAPGAAVTSAKGAGAGPFIPTTITPLRRMALTAFGQHVRGRPFLDSVQLEVHPSPRVFGAEIQAGDLDLALGRGEAGERASTLLLVLDRSRPPFDDARVRRALAHSIDRAFLVQSFWPEAEPASSLLVPELIAPAASGTGPVAKPRPSRIALRVGSDVPHVVSQRVVAHLSVLGLDVDAAPVPPREVWETPAPARLLIWFPEVAEAGLALEELAARAASRSALDLLAAAHGERDAARRRDLLQRAEAALREEAALIPLARAPLPLKVRDGVLGVKVTATGRLSLEDVWVMP